MRLIALGSGGWIPTEKRHTASYLVDTGESLILLDTGSGLSRLGDYIDILNKYDEINIIYSHYHLDHLVGISYLNNWSKNKRLNIYGPGKNLGCKDCKEVLTDLLVPPYYPLTIDKFANEINIKDYDLQGFSIGSIPVKINTQVHSGNSFGITIGDYVHYASDTTILEETFKRAERTKLLLHECWTIMNENNKDHSSYEEISDMLTKFDIQCLGLIHINPNWETEDFEKLLSTFNIESKIKIVEDGMEFNL